MVVKEMGDIIPGLWAEEECVQKSGCPHGRVCREMGKALEQEWSKRSPPLIDGGVFSSQMASEGSGSVARKLR